MIYAYLAFFLLTGTASAARGWINRPQYAFGLRRATALVGLCSATITIVVFWLYLCRSMWFGSMEWREARVIIGVGVWTDFLALLGYAGKETERYALVTAVLAFFLWLPYVLAIATV